MIRTLGMVALAVGAFGLVACGDDDEEEEKAKTTTLTVSLSAQNKLQGLKTIEGGVVKLDFTNRSKSPYDLGLVRTDGNQTAAQVLKVVAGEGGKIPGWAHGAGGVGTVKPGASASATQVLEPGNYYAIAGPDEEDAKPVIAKFKIEGGTGTGELPAADATVTAFEYGFRTSGLRTGGQTIEFENTGNELHHVVAFQLAPGKTLADFKKFIQTEKGEAPFVEDSVVNTAVLDGKTKQVAVLDFKKPGNYALACFITDRAGGPPHVAKGMVTETEVKAG